MNVLVKHHLKEILLSYCSIWYFEAGFSFITEGNIKYVSTKAPIPNVYYSPTLLNWKKFYFICVFWPYFLKGAEQPSNCVDVIRKELRILRWNQPSIPGVCVTISSWSSDTSGKINIFETLEYKGITKCQIEHLKILTFNDQYTDEARLLNFYIFKLILYSFCTWILVRSFKYISVHKVFGINICSLLMMTLIQKVLLLHI